MQLNNQSGVIPSGQTIAIVTHPAVNKSKPNVIDSYIYKQALVLGIIQACIGLLCIILQSVAISLDAHSSSAATGIWCGIPYFLTGLLGIWSSRSKTRCVIIACMVFCIVTAIIFVLPLTIAAVVGMLAERLEKETDTVKVNLNYALMGLSLIEFLITIWASIICCNGVCCGYRRLDNDVTLTHQGPSQGVQQVVVVQQPVNTTTTSVQRETNQTQNRLGYSNNNSRSLPPVPTEDERIYTEIADTPEYSLSADYDGYLQPVESSGSLIPKPASDEGYLNMSGTAPSTNNIKSAYNEMIPPVIKHNTSSDESYEDPLNNATSYEALRRDGAYQALNN